MYKPLLIGVFSGALLGLLAYGGWVASAEDAAKSPTPTPEQLAQSACEEELVAVQAKVEAARLNTDSIVGRLNQTRKARAARLGQRLDWPDYVPDFLQPDAVEAHVVRALEGTSGRVIDVDCEHYPCVAVMGWTHAADADPAHLQGPDGNANIPGAMLAKLTGDGAYASVPHFETGRLLEGSTETLHSIMWFPADEFRISKHPQDPEATRQDGSRIEQIQGRLHHVTDDWQAEGVP